MENKRHWHAESLEDVRGVTHLTQGLSEEEYGENYAMYGPNRLEEGKKASLWKMLLDQFNNTMILILVIASVISFFLGEAVDATIILAIVVLNAVMGVVQENKAEQALNALKEMSAPSAKVIRDGKELIIPSQEVVPFDILLLEAGDVVAADVRLLKTSSTQIQEASLTGESVPVDKSADHIAEENAALGDRKNMAYASSMVTYGRATGLVVATGMQTEVGKIASLLSSSEKEQTPLQIKLDHLGKILGYAALGAVILIFGVGLLYGHEPLDLFLTAVSLAVAVIPESLPAVATIVLAMGVQRLAKRNAIIRNLSSVETLGSATVICSDKTGTLTQNKMTVMEVHSEDEVTLQRAILLCNDARLVDKLWVGDPTETALSVYASLKGLDLVQELLETPRVAEVPFDSARKRMSTVHQSGSEFIVYVKGGMDEVLQKTTHILDHSGPRMMTEADMKDIHASNQTMGSKALRVLAIATKTISSPVKDGDRSIEENLCFIGLVGMIDPARPEVKAAVRECKEAGIRVVMITGDHKTTAQAIGAEIGLLESHHQVITGVELDAMRDDELFDKVQDIGVYARVSPTHKMRIIDAWKKHGEIVAMTGDGVNDAPALKKSDIGAAMGVVGTEVAKGAADMVLADDNFATVVHAVEEGRRIRDNILKAISYLLSCNVGELSVLLVATFLNWSAPLLPIHILWINLVTDSLPALALGVDPAEPGLMKKQPRKDTSLLSSGMMYRITYQGLLIGTLTLIAYLFGSGKLGVEGTESLGQTMAFAVLAFSQLVHSFNVRSSRYSILPRFFENKALLYATLVNTGMMLAVLFVPFLSQLFKLTPLDVMHWEVVLMLVFIPLPFVEVLKAFKLNGKD